ncbi:MAG: TonB-dependent receptor [Pseudomonadota bacterium]
MGSSVTVLNEPKIVESQAIVVADLLATTPGVNVTRNGGPGTQTSVRIRGAESDQTLVLIDGVQINDPSSTGGGFDFGNLLVGDIGRIEILRGPQSTLYGSQAMGGVVNIITREPQGALAVNVEAELGSMSTRQLSAGVGEQFDRASFRLAGAYYDTDGVSSYDAGTETDPFRNSTFTGKFGFAFTPDVSLDVRGYYADSKSHYDGFPPPNYTFADEGDFGTTTTWIGYGGLNFALAGGALHNRIAYQYTDNDRGAYLHDGTNVIDLGQFKGKNNRVEYQGTWKINEAWQVVFGAQHEKSAMNSDSEPQHVEASIDSIYMQLQAEVVTGLTLTAGDRYDDHDTFGSHNSVQVAAAWAIGTGTMLRGSWGQGFKAPTLYQLYSPYANQDLKPESSQGWDLGVEQKFMDNRAMVSAIYFDRTSTDLISFSNCPDDGNSICGAPGHSPFGYYSNTARARSKGFELQAMLQPLSELTLEANFTHMEATDESPGAATEGQRLLRRPDDAANLSLSYKWPVRLTTTLAVRYSGKSYDMNFDTFPAERVTLDQFTLVDIRAAYDITDKVSVSARVENLFDADYRAGYQYGTTGRAGYASVNYKF